MSFPFVDLSKLLLTAHFHSNSIFEYVLDFLAQVRSVWPCNLDTCWSLGNVDKDSLTHRVFKNQLSFFLFINLRFNASCFIWFFGLHVIWFWISSLSCDRDWLSFSQSLIKSSIACPRNSSVIDHKLLFWIFMKYNFCLWLISLCCCRFIYHWLMKQILSLFILCLLCGWQGKLGRHWNLVSWFLADRGFFTCCLGRLLFQKRDWVQSGLIAC